MMKFAASVSLAALALAGCASTPPAQMAVAAPAEVPATTAADVDYPLTPDGAREFVAAVEKDLYDFSLISSRAAWVNATYINDDSDAVAAYFGTIGTERASNMPPMPPNMPASRVSTSTPPASST